MKVLVTFALAHEFAPWRKRREFRPVSREAGAEGLAPSLFEARVGEVQVHALLTGMGWKPARASMQFALGERYDVCISSGLAGGLKMKYRPGDVIAARLVREADGRRALTCDPELVQLAGECGALVCENLLSSRRLVLDALEKRRLGLLGDAVDMESFRILTASCRRGIRSLAVRAVSDGAEMEMPLDFSRTLDARGAIQLSRVMSHVVRRPSRLPGLVRLGRQSTRAAERLVEFLDRFVLEGAKSDFRAFSQAAAG
jgi:nucleoside phosphorylase